MSTNNKEILLPLQGLRALACLGIFSFHLEITNLGRWGVSIFIALSGFLMYYQYEDKTINTSILDNLMFSLNKIKKIYPLHILLMIIGIFRLVDKYYYFGVDSILMPCVVLNFTLLQAWITHYTYYFSINGVAWYLSLCLFLYFAFPNLLNRIKKNNSNKKAILSIIVVYILQIILAKTSSYIHVPDTISNDFIVWFTYIFPLFRLGDFYIGCNLGYLFVNRNKEKNLTVLKASVLEIATAICICFTVYFSEQAIYSGINKWYAFSVAYVPATMSAIYLLAINRGIIAKLITNKLLIYISNLSAYIFLIHELIILYYDDYLISYYPFGNIYIKIFICVSLSIILAILWKKLIGGVQA